MKIAGLALAIVATLAAGACSSTRRADGTTVSETVEINVRTEPDGARCSLTRSGKVIATVAATPEKVTIERGIRPITVSCEKDGHVPGAQTMQSTYVGGQGAQPQQYDYSVAGSIGYGLGLAIVAGVRAGSPANYEYASFVTVAVPSNTFADAAARDAKYAELRSAIEERHKRKLEEVQKNCGDNADLCRTAKRDAEKENADELARLDGFRQQAVIEPPKPAAPPAKDAKKPAPKA